MDGTTFPLKLRRFWQDLHSEKEIPLRLEHLGDHFTMLTALGTTRSRQECCMSPRAPAGDTAQESPAPA
jgi:hypothetical protein